MTVLELRGVSKIYGEKDVGVLSFVGKIVLVP